MASCGQMIEGNVVAFMCDLESGHDGPHRAYENARSVRERAKWVEDQKKTPEQRHADSGLSQFQGRAQTTAERYTENPTPVPQTRQQREEPLRPSGLEQFHRRSYVGEGAEGEQQAEDLGQHEHPVVYTEDAEGAQFRHASTAEATVAGLNPSHVAAYGEAAARGHEQVAGLTEQQMDDMLAGKGAPEGVHIPGITHPLTGIANLEPTKQREGDQPLPTPTQGEYVQDRIIAKIEAIRPQIGDEQAEVLIRQMEESKKVGTQRYGTPLQTFNGRDCLQDLADELRDGYVYVNSLMQAREAQREDLIEVVQQTIEKEYADGAGKDGVLYEVFPNAEALAKMAVDAILKATGGFGT